MIIITDWNEDKEYGTLKVYDGKDPEEIAEEVHELDAVSGDRIVYIYDYSLKSYKGELYEWSDGKNKKIDEDVAGIIRSYGYNGGFINY